MVRTDRHAPHDEEQPQRVVTGGSSRRQVILRDVVSLVPQPDHVAGTLLERRGKHEDRMRSEQRDALQPVVEAIAEIFGVDISLDPELVAGRLDVEVRVAAPADGHARRLVGLGDRHTQSPGRRGREGRPSLQLLLAQPLLMLGAPAEQRGAPRPSHSHHGGDHRQQILQPQRPKTSRTQQHRHTPRLDPGRAGYPPAQEPAA